MASWTRELRKDITQEEWSQMVEKLAEILQAYNIPSYEKVERCFREGVLGWFSISITDEVGDRAKKLELEEARALFADCARIFLEHNITLWYNEDFNGVWIALKDILDSTNIRMPHQREMCEKTPEDPWRWLREELGLPIDRPNQEKENERGEARTLSSL